MVSPHPDDDPDHADGDPGRAAQNNCGRDNTGICDSPGYACHSPGKRDPTDPMQKHRCSWLKPVPLHGALHTINTASRTVTHMKNDKAVSMVTEATQHDPIDDLKALDSRCQTKYCGFPGPSKAAGVLSTWAITDTESAGRQAAPLSPA